MPFRTPGTLSSFRIVKKIRKIRSSALLLQTVPGLTAAQAMEAAAMYMAYLKAASSAQSSADRASKAPEANAAPVSQPSKSDRSVNVSSLKRWPSLVPSTCLVQRHVLTWRNASA